MANEHEHEYEIICKFLSRHKYPSDYSKNEKRALRRKATSYKVENCALLYLTKKGSAQWKQVPQSAEEKDRILEIISGVITMPCAMACNWQMNRTIINTCHNHNTRRL